MIYFYWASWYITLLALFDPLLYIKLLSSLTFEQCSFFPLALILCLAYWSVCKPNVILSCDTWMLPEWQVIICGLIGIPPSNGVIPQSPMHTKSLATLKHQVDINYNCRFPFSHSIKIYWDNCWQYTFMSTILIRPEAFEEKVETEYIVIKYVLLLSSYLYLGDLQLLRNRLVAAARSSMRKQECLGQVYRSMQDAYWQMQTPLVHEESSSQVHGIVVF